MTAYFYLKNGKVTGPVKVEEIKKMITMKKIGGFDLIYRNDEKKWKPVVEFEELSDEFQGEDLENPDDEVTGSYDLTQLTVPKQEKEKQWVVLRILDRLARPVKSEQLGPFSTSVVQKMIRSGDLSFQDYVWTDGMTKWGLLVEQEELVPKIELPSLVETLTVEDTVKQPEASSEELFRSVEVTQPGAVMPEEIPEEAVVEETVGKVVVEEAVDGRQAGKNTTASPERQQKPAVLDVTDKIEREPRQRKPPLKTPDISHEDVEIQQRSFKFRLLQGIFAAFVIGSVMGLVFVLSHSPEERENFTFQPEAEQKPPEPQPAPAPPRPKAEAEKPETPAIAPAPPEEPKPPPKVAPSFVRLQVKDAEGKKPRVEVKTDASHHYPAEFLLTGAAGQILSYPSYHREWRVKEFHEKFRTVDLNYFGLGAGWYTLIVKVGDRRALSTFFIGNKSRYRTAIRQHRKSLGYRHQLEKEEFYYLLEDVQSSLRALKKVTESRKMNPGEFDSQLLKAQSAGSKALGRVRKRLQKKNDQLWTVYWFQFDEYLKSNDLFLSELQSNKKTVRSSEWKAHEKGVRDLLGKIQDLKVVN